MLLFVGRSLVLSRFDLPLFDSRAYCGAILRHIADNLIQMATGSQFLRRFAKKTSSFSRFDRLIPGPGSTSCLRLRLTLPSLFPTSSSPLPPPSPTRNLRPLPLQLGSPRIAYAITVNVKSSDSRLIQLLG